MSLIQQVNFCKRNLKKAILALRVLKRIKMLKLSIQKDCKIQTLIFQSIRFLLSKLRDNMTYLFLKREDEVILH